MIAPSRRRTGARAASFASWQVRIPDPERPMRPYGRTSGTLRLVAASVSLALTLAVFLLLRATSAPAPAKRAEMHVGVTVFPLPAARREAAPPPSAATPVKGGARSRRRSGRAARYRRPGWVRNRSRPWLPPACRPASRPKARPRARRCGSTRKRSAERSPAPKATSSRWRGAAASSSIRRAPVAQSYLQAPLPRRCVPDCLAPKGGGSLLSAPILLLMAIQGKCK